MELECRTCVTSTMIGGLLYCKSLAQYQPGIVTLLKCPIVGRHQSCRAVTRVLEPVQHDHANHVTMDTPQENADHVDKARTLIQEEVADDEEK